MSQFLSNNVNSFNTVNLESNRTSANDRSQILNWLSELHPRSRHEEIQDQRVEGVGEWVLQTEEFRRWNGGGEGDASVNAVLFCYGGPEAGQVLKTHDVSSLAIDALCDRARERDIAVACFYLDSTAQKEPSPTSVLGALLRQAVAGLEEIPGEIAQAHEDQRNCIGGRGPQHTDIVKMLQNTSSKKRTFICIDALDECMRRQRVKLLDSLNQILQKAPSTRIFLTGGLDIRPEIENPFAGKVTSLSISPKRDDHIRYLAEDTTSDRMDSLEAKIPKKITENISQMYAKQRHWGGYLELSTDRYLPGSPLVSPDIEATPRKRQKLPPMADCLGLEGPCGPTPCRVEGKGGEKARPSAATSIRISHPRRPLKVELRHTLVIEIGFSDLGTEANGVSSKGTSLTYRQLPTMADKTVSTVWLAYPTLQEDLQPHTEIFGSARPTAAETCLGHSNSQKVRAFSTSSLPQSPRIPPSRKPLSVPDNPRKKRPFGLRETTCAKSV